MTHFSIANFVYSYDLFDSFSPNNFAVFVNSTIL